MTISSAIRISGGYLFPDPMDTLTDFTWVTHPENVSGCPAIYICRNCGRQFRWFETDGEAGPHCRDCDRLRLLERRHPIRVAKVDKWSETFSTTFDRTYVPALRTIKTALRAENV
jgi:DNA-directed RNA polymerase subunit RPC12/RpoP